MAVKRHLRVEKPRKKVSECLKLFKFKRLNILILAKKNILKNIEHLDRFFNIDFILVNQDELYEKINEQTVAIVIDEMEAKGHLKSYTQNLIFSLEKIDRPIFVLARNKLSESTSSQLYAMGVHAIISWPNESAIFTELFIESLKPHEKAQGTDKGDIHLANLIESHMQLHEGTRNVSVKVIHGLAFLQGSVPSLWEKRRAIDEVSHIFGVKKAVADDVEIKKSLRLSDREIETLIRSYIKSLDRKSTINCNVKDRIVTLSATDLDDNIFFKIEKYAMKQKGILGVNKQIKNIPAYASKNTRLDRKLEESVQTIFDGVKSIHVRVYGDIVELKGCVTLQADRKLIEDYIIQKTHLKKVVNKIKLAKI